MTQQLATSMQEKAVEVLFDSVKDRLDCSLAKFKETLKDWDFIPLMDKDEVVGAVAAKGNELHIGYKVKPTASIRGHLRSTLKKTLDQYGCAITRVAANNSKSIEFCKRLGFEITNEAQGIIHMRCNRSKYV
jgi:hypothetical protein